jgi:acetoin utilization protein AcuB
MTDTTIVATEMTKNVAVATPREPLSAAFARMRKRCVRHLPVVDGGRLVGILSDRDVMRQGTLQGGSLALGELTVAQAMTSTVYTCRPSDSLPSAAAAMIRHHVDALPVVDDHGLVRGIITSLDVLRHIADPGWADLATLLEHRVQRYDFGELIDD